MTYIYYANLNRHSSHIHLRGCSRHCPSQDAITNPNFPLRSKDHLRAGRQSRGAGSGLAESDLGGTAAGKAGQHNAAALVPLGELLGADGVGGAAGVEAVDEGGGAGGAAADVEGPADEGAVLVGVEDDAGGGVEGDAVLGDLLEHESVKGIRRPKKGERGRTARSLWRSLRPSASDRGME